MTIIGNCWLIRNTQIMRYAEILSAAQVRKDACRKRFIRQQSLDTTIHKWEGQGRLIAAMVLVFMHPAHHLTQYLRLLMHGLI